ncbi:MAG TPA: di-heme oxidoredictase family protein [Vicinamibacterales bacterium]|jgi:CxxC motif-containing protein (DUF1111 family)
MLKRIFTTSLGLVLAGAILFAQGRPLQPGDPLLGLTPTEFEEFRLGLDDFLEVESTEEGLGPAFNGTSCAICHNLPAVGGSGIVAEVRAARRMPDGQIQTVDASGETVIQLFSIPTHNCQPAIPADYNVVARRLPIPLFGAGLVEAIEDSTLMNLEDPLDRNRDGISGRISIVTDQATGDRRVGRFGWKAQQATLLTFGAEAYRTEMGITNDVFPAELGLGLSPSQMTLCDPIPEPEDIPDPRTRRRGIDNFASFMRFLSPVPRGPIDETVRAGEVAFNAIGCSTCHIPALVTGPSTNPLFNRRPVPLFSDLLLHDIGTGDGIRQGIAEPDEIRTPALWGLRFRRPLLHDGSAATIEDAIARHDREAALARQGVQTLSDAGRAALLAFLRSL